MGLLETLMVVWSFIPTQDHPNILELSTPFLRGSSFQDDNQPLEMSLSDYTPNGIHDKDIAWAKAHGIDPKALSNWQNLDDDLDFIDDTDFSFRDKLIDMAQNALGGVNETGDVIYPEAAEGKQAAPGNVPSAWPNGKIPYVIDSSLNVLQNKIHRAIKQYHEKTCVRFVHRTNQKNYLVLQRGTGCNSNLGMKGGRQLTNLGNGCGYLGTILHELGHVLGLIHEHQRPDRDDYLKIYFKNIKQGSVSQFTKRNPIEPQKEAKFSYDSIMIYGNYAFSKEPGRLKTMVAKDGTELKDPFQKSALDQVDIDAINEFYSC